MYICIYFSYMHRLPIGSTSGIYEGLIEIIRMQGIGLKIHDINTAVATKNDFNCVIILDIHICLSKKRRLRKAESKKGEGGAAEDK